MMSLCHGLDTGWWPKSNSLAQENIWEILTLLYDKVLDPIKIKKENAKHDKEQLQDLSTVKPSHT